MPSHSRYHAHPSSVGLQKKKSGAVGGEWGKYGILNETECVPELAINVPQISRSTHSHVFCSMYSKESEFRAWLVEERKINPETISKDQTKKEFARFVEDYNTGMSESCLIHPRSDTI